MSAQKVSFTRLAKSENTEFTHRDTQNHSSLNKTLRNSVFASKLFSIKL